MELDASREKTRTVPPVQPSVCIGSGGMMKPVTLSTPGLIRGGLRVAAAASGSTSALLREVQSAAQAKWRRA